MQKFLFVFLFITFFISTKVSAQDRSTYDELLRAINEGIDTTNSIDFNHFNYYRWQEEMEKIDSLPTSETNKIKEVYMYSRRGCNLQLIASLFSKLYSKTKDSSQLQIAHFFAMNCIRSLPTILSKFPNLKHLTFVFTPNF